jgi:hypothetical protein
MLLRAGEELGPAKENRNGKSPGLEEAEMITIHVVF